MRAYLVYQLNGLSRLILILVMLLIAGCNLPGIGQSIDDSSKAAENSSEIHENWYEVYFTQPLSPESQFYRGGPAEVLVEEIGSARLSVDVAAYGFNLWGIRDALIDAQARGVTIRVVTDSDHFAWEEVQELVMNGIPVVGDYSDSLMHNKFFIIDRQLVFTGSMNPTVGGAYYDNNNLIGIRSTHLAEYYGLEFEEMFSDRLFSRASPSSDSAGVVTIDNERTEVYFSPEAGVAKRIIELVEAARASIHFLAYSFTSDEIADAMIGRAQAGLDITGVIERSQYYSNEGTEFDRLRLAGVDVRLDGNNDNMHHKVIIIDERIVITGSYNFSRSAEESNDENVLIIHSPDLAAIYAQEFERIWVESQESLD